MRNRESIIFVFILAFICDNVASQELIRGPGFSSVIAINPSWAGAEGGRNFEMNYTGFYPGRNLGISMISASYEQYSEVLHGGAGIWISEKSLGDILNEVSGGFSWSYHLQAGRELFVNGGLGASFIHMGIDRGSIVLPDQIDALSGVTGISGEVPEIKGRTVPDISAGTLVSYRNYHGSLSVTHLTKPVIYRGGSGDYRINRSVYAKFFAVFEGGGLNKYVLVPVLTAEISGKNKMLGAGLEAEKSIFSLNSVLVTDLSGNTGLQAGMGLKITYITLIYNYFYNISTADKLLPSALFHHVGIRISLNNVEKRKNINAIYFPKL